MVGRPSPRKCSMVAFVTQREGPRKYAPKWGDISLLRGAALMICCSVSWAASARAGDLEGAEKLLRTGHYDECVRLAEEGIDNNARSEPWRRLKIQAELARGEYEAALDSLDEALRRLPASVSLHLLGRDLYRYNGRAADATTALDRIERLILSAPQRYATPEGRVALGRFFLLRGADARKVIDQFYDVATKQEPDFVEGFLATAELALDKQDYALAAATLQKAPKDAAQDPRFHYLLARAFSADDRARSSRALADALKINPHHTDSLLLQADHQIDAERYPDAEQSLQRVLDVNPHEPR